MSETGRGFVFFIFGIFLARAEDSVMPKYFQRDTVVWSKTSSQDIYRAAWVSPSWQLADLAPRPYTPLGSGNILFRLARPIGYVLSVAAASSDMYVPKLPSVNNNDALTRDRYIRSRNPWSSLNGLKNNGKAAALAEFKPEIDRFKRFIPFHLIK